MNWYIYLVGILLVTAFLNSVLAVVFARSTKARVWMVITFAVGLFLTFSSPFELLGRAKPSDWAWLERNVKEAAIKGVELRENEGIYLMLIVNDEPRLYVFPWNPKMAENIQQAMAQAQAQGTEAVLGRPFQNGTMARAANGVQSFIEGLLGIEGEGQGQGGQGQGQQGEGNGQGEPGNFSGSLEDRNAPIAYPRPQQALPPKPPTDQGQIYRPDRN